VSFLSAQGLSQLLGALERAVALQVAGPISERSIGCFLSEAGVLSFVVARTSWLGSAPRNPEGDYRSASTLAANPNQMWDAYFGGPDECATEGLEIADGFVPAVRAGSCTN